MGVCDQLYVVAELLVEDGPFVGDRISAGVRTTRRRPSTTKGARMDGVSGGTALRPPHHICRQVTPFLAAHVRVNEVCSAQL